MWTHSVYFTGLLVGLAGTGIIDWRYKLALFHDWRRTIKTILPAMLVFVVWDVAGIMLGIFSDGDGSYRSGLQLGPHFPVEEVFFLALLSYFTLVVWRLLSREKDRESA